MKWQDVDLEKETLTVKLNLQRLPGGGLRLQKPKTKTSIRTIRLGKESLSVLAEQRNLLAKEKSLANGLWQDDGYVFPSSIGSAMDASNLWKHFRRILKQSKLPAIRFHDLRHTAASLMLNNGVDVLVASRRLGHAKPSITLDVYGHLIPSSQAGVADVLDKLVSGK
ncbi:MAG: site-specific integrase [Anaerolineales bacterium]|nr:site-specific integrase [Anaerolineales bacterium]